MLFTPIVKPGFCNKFQKCNSGPFRVIKKSGPANFIIQSIKDCKNVHVDRISKIIYKPSFSGWLDEISSEVSKETIYKHRSSEQIQVPSL